MSLTISVARTPEQRDAVFRLRYTVLVEESRLSPTLADHHFRCIEEPLDATARFVIARYGDTVVGALRVNYLAEGHSGDEEAFFHVERFREAHPHTIAFTTPPLVASGFRTSSVPQRLAVTAYAVNLEDGITHDFVACQPDEEVFFRDLGYRPYCGRARHPERGDVLPMVLVLRDHAHLDHVRSPLAARLRESQSQRITRISSPR